MSGCDRRGGAPFWLAGALAVVLSIAAGIGYRVAAEALERNPISLPVPLSAIPMEIEGWAGRDVSLETTTDAYMKANFADDYVSRRYVNQAEGVGADVYVVYCSSHPAGLLGHRPDVCFPAHDWVSDSKTATEITLKSGRTIECLMHRFHKSWPAYAQEYVLSFYILNGQITLQENDFSGFFDRSPNINGDPARYVAQVQISSPWERSCQLAARDMAETLLSFLPDRHGRVKAAAFSYEAAPEPVADVNY
jgi:hypothetical protein